MAWTDNQLLDMLRMRDAGKSFTEIGEALGVGRGAVSGSLGRIDRELRASGETEGWDTWASKRQGAAQ